MTKVPVNIMFKSALQHKTECYLGILDVTMPLEVH